MSAKSKNISHKENTNSQNWEPIYRIGLLAVLSLLLFYPPYFKGLFFDDEFLPSLVYSSVLFLLFLVYKFFIKKDIVFFKSTVDYAALAVAAAFLLPVIFGQAVNLRSAIGEFFKYCNYFAVYIMVRELVTGEKLLKTAINVILASAVGVALFGIDAAAGEYVQKFIGEIIDYRFFGGFLNGRISSTLQYPNTLAAYLMAMFFLSAGMQLDSKKLWQKGLYSSIGFIFISTFLQTYSRGALILFPVIYILFLVFLFDIRKAADVLLHSLGIFAVSVLTYDLFSDCISGGNFFGIWLTALAGAMAVFLLTFAIDIAVKQADKADKKVLKTILAVIISFIVLVSASYLAIALNSEEDVILSHGADESESPKLFMKYIPFIKPNTQYTLTFDIEAKTNNPDNWAGRISIYPIGGKNAEKKLYNNIYYKESGEHTITFMTPEDSGSIRIEIRNLFPDTSFKIKNARLSSENSQEKRLTLKYKYIPERYVAGVEEILAGETETYERFVYYIDAMKIFMDYPVFGAGGKAWENIHYKYQSYNYSSKQAHGYFVQTLVETGLIGFIAVIVFFSMVFRIYVGIKDSLVLKAAGTAVFAFIIHAAVDFDFSMAAIMIIVWALIGMLVSVRSEEKKNSSDRKQKTIAGSILTVSVLLTVVSSCFSIASANAIRGDIFVDINNLKIAADHYERAVRFDPIKAGYRVTLGQIYAAQSAGNEEKLKKAEELLSSAVLLEPYNADFSKFAGQLYFSRGNIEKTLDFVDKMIENQPLNPVVYEDKAIAYFEASMFYYANNQKDKARESMEKVIRVEDFFEEMNKKLTAPVKLSGNIKNIIARSIYMLLNIDKPERIWRLEEYINKGSIAEPSGVNFMPDGWIYDDAQLKEVRSEKTLSDAEKRLAYVEKLCEYMPYNPLSYEQKALEYFKAAGEYFYNDNFEKVKEYLQKIWDTKEVMIGVNNKLEQPMMMTEALKDVVGRGIFLFLNFNKPHELKRYQDKKFVYRSRLDVDFDKDTIPDGWNVTPNLKLSLSGRLLKIKNLGNTEGYIESEIIGLDKKEKYIVVAAARGSAKRYGIEVVDKARNITMLRQFHVVEEYFQDIILDFSTNIDEDQPFEPVVRIICPEGEGEMEIDRVYVFRY